MTGSSDDSVTEVRLAIDVKNLEKYLEKQQPGNFKAPFALKQFGYGQSNPSYLIVDANDRKYVLRKQPPGKLLAKSAHRMDREYAMIKALENTDVPVPKVYVLCQDKEVLGTDFYIMEFLQGRIFHTPEFAGVSAEDRTLLWRDAIRALAKLHAVDPTKIGLPQEFTRSVQSHFPRQLKTLTKVSENQSQAKDKKTGEEQGPLPHLQEIVGWLAKHMPSNRAGIVHGDYKIDNLVYHPKEPKVIGILDWELCTVGHPLADLGNLLQPYSLPPADPGSAMSLRQDIPGIPALKEQLREYYSISGYNPVPDWPFAVVYSHFRLAVILQGITARNKQGNASSASAAKYAMMVDLFDDFAFEATKKSAKL